MNIKSERMYRLTKANTLIETIANGGRQFFRYKHRVASFNLDDRQRLWWIDDYTRKPLYLHYKYWYQGFSHGGTLQALVEALKSYVQVIQSTQDTLALGLIGFVRAISGATANIWESFDRKHWN